MILIFCVLTSCKYKGSWFLCRRWRRLIWTFLKKGLGFYQRLYSYQFVIRKSLTIITFMNTEQGLLSTKKDDQKKVWILPMVAFVLLLACLATGAFIQCNESSLSLNLLSFLSTIVIIPIFTTRISFAFQSLVSVSKINNACNSECLPNSFNDNSNVIYIIYYWWLNWVNTEAVLNEYLKT